VHLQAVPEYVAGMTHGERRHDYFGFMALPLVSMMTCTGVDDAMDPLAPETHQLHLATSIVWWFTASHWSDDEQGQTYMEDEFVVPYDLDYLNEDGTVFTYDQMMLLNLVETDGSSHLVRRRYAPEKSVLSHEPV